MSDDHVIEAIDTALRDFETGPDAMRWVPDEVDAARLAVDGVPTISVDLAPFAEAMCRLARGVAKMVPRLTQVVREAVNDPALVSGLEARYYVRASLDPAYAALPAVDQLVREILDGRAEGARLLTAENRRLVAIAAMRGWVTHR